MSGIERALLWIVAIAGLIGAGYNYMAGKELTAWARSIPPWAVHWDTAHHPGGPPGGDHVPPPPPPPDW